MLHGFSKFAFIATFFFMSRLLAGDFSHLDPQKLVPPAHLKSALETYLKWQDKIKNKAVMTIIDYRQHNSRERFYLIDMESGHVETYLAAHGRNSDPDFDGYATKFSNIIDSKQTSLGYFLTAETYYGENGYSLRLDGKSQTNSNARVRAIVIHGAPYVAPGDKIGRSYGCPALEMRYHQEVIDKIKGGSLVYAVY